MSISCVLVSFRVKRIKDGRINDKITQTVTNCIKAILSVAFCPMKWYISSFSRSPHFEAATSILMQENIFCVEARKETFSIAFFSQNFFFDNTMRSVWTKEDDNLLHSLYKSHGKQWRKICKHFQMRSDDAVRNRILRLYNLDNKTRNVSSKSPRSSYSETEDRLILEHVRNNGRKWEHLILPGRTSHSIRNRFHRLVEYMDDTKNEAIADNSSNVCEEEKTVLVNSEDVLAALSSFQF